MSRGSGSLAERLRWARERAFVGRLEELAAFRDALSGAPDAPAVLYVHGPGGVGKSTLLRRFADESRDAGRPVVEVNGRLIDPSPAGFRAEAEAVGAAPDTVLLIDAFEHCQGLEGWLRDHFLPGLPGRTLTVLAGREAPSSAWRADLAWSEALAVVPLADLAPADAARLLELRDVAPLVREQVLAFAGGHPLALSLAAGVAAHGEDKDWEPTPDVLTALLSQMVGEVPTPDHRLALEMAAHAMTTTEGLLRAVLGPDRGAELFTWLRRLPVADWGRQGVFLHDLVSDAVDADLRWRDPQGYEEMHRRVGHHLLEQARTASPAEAMVAIREISYLKRYGPMGEYFQMRREGDYHEDVLRPGDYDAVRRLITEAEGPESAAVVDFWLERQPEAFWMYRESATGEPVAFMTWLRLSEPRPDELAADPVMAQAWEHTLRTSPLRPGEHLLLARFLIHPPAYYEISPVLHLMQLRICADYIRSGSLAWSFIISPFPQNWEALMEHLGHERATALPWPNGHTYTLFACDWRVTPLSIWFDRTQPGALTETPARPAADAPAAPLTRAAFDTAVRDALRDWHRPDVLAAGPLRTTRMVTGQPGFAAEHSGEMLRELLSDAVDALRADPRDAKLHRVLATTFFHRVPSHMVAAERLSLPYSTYRRHLQRGCERVCDILWQRETAGLPIPSPHP
ncbi:ATP-binding protein [Streptomyces abyssomicinicus]|uniref:ATP-binding protein n=1 Tax=Streptomyces abyssomicinicus TaxID=574929 RepID=UPI0013DE9972|nr:ATP-binding protein [Streptomyces abyssomicinicus]